jgi:signal transduction histidine kinase
MIGFFKSGKGGISRFRWITKSGKSIWVESRSTIVKDKKGKPVGMRGVTMDISERIEFENRKDEFLGIASHELRTPLTSIKGYIQILERLIKTNPSPDRVMNLLRRTDTYTDKLNGLINDLLDVSKIQAGKLTLNKSQFSVDELVQESIESIQPISPKHQIIYKNRIEKTIKGDRIRIEQVITNLLSNAIKYSPKSHEIYVYSGHKDNIVTISVQDFGIGIPKNKQSFLFQRYYRVEDTEKKFSGMGIGLYISNEIVKRHKGAIIVKSDGKRGTTFEVQLPIT